MSYDKRHGGPYDRGGADRYYDREYDPHYYVGDTAITDRVEMHHMTAEQIVAYTVGYNQGDKE
jgi:hypothetical protein